MFYTTADMQARFGLEDKETARKYLQRLVSHADWEPTEAVTPRKPGRPQTAIAPIHQRL